MKPFYLYLIFLFNTATSHSQSIPVPEHYSIINSVAGDLDKDGVNELVVAYNTSKENDEIKDNVSRELIIYKKRHSKWVEWQKSTNALYGSRDGGMMGDPFGDITIEKGVLHISQEGGSSWKWFHTDKYQFDNNTFRLIGYTSNYGKPCEYWEEVDFNLLTGKLIIKKEYENCETANQEIYKRQNETFNKRGVYITLQKRNEKQIKIISPKYRHEIYVAVKAE